jgi:hypothetical protein
MVSDADLARGTSVGTAKEAARPAARGLQPKSRRPGKKGTKFLFLLAGNLIFWAVVYYLWTANENSRIRVFCTFNKGIVTGILYNRENPSAVVCGQVVGEGEIARGYKVIKIYKDKVELEKEGKRITRSVH